MQLNGSIDGVNYKLPQTSQLLLLSSKRNTHEYYSTNEKKLSDGENQPTWDIKTAREKKEQQ